jgi:hypothetical protein
VLQYYGGGSGIGTCPEAPRRDAPAHLASDLGWHDGLDGDGRVGELQGHGFYFVLTFFEIDQAAVVQRLAVRIV